MRGSALLYIYVVLQLRSLHEFEFFAGLGALFIALVRCFADCLRYKLFQYASNVPSLWLLIDLFGGLIIKNFCSRALMNT